MNIVLWVVTLECLEPGHFCPDSKLEEIPPVGDISKSSSKNSYLLPNDLAKSLPYVHRDYNYILVFYHLIWSERKRLWDFWEKSPS